jgi:hypothetical protein
MKWKVAEGHTSGLRVATFEICGGLVVDVLPICKENHGYVTGS